MAVTVPYLGFETIRAAIRSIVTDGPDDDPIAVNEFQTWLDLLQQRLNEESQQEQESLRASGIVRMVSHQQMEEEPEQDEGT